MKVRECMSTPVHSLSADQTIQEAAAAMREFSIAELVVQMNDKVAGFITDRDIINCCAAEGVDPTSTTVGQFMRQDVVRCKEDRDIEEAAALMDREKTQHLVVVNNQDEVTGILSLLNSARQQVAEGNAKSVLNVLCGRPQ
ncbi:MAG: CBS domain-containing protein [Candidatus Pacebacteria bacterium]|nr:CBS domain-containing protein [Candidatus Paceibacterota bacterium]